MADALNSSYRAISQLSDGKGCKCDVCNAVNPSYANSITNLSSKALPHDLSEIITSTVRIANSANLLTMKKLTNSSKVKKFMKDNQLNSWQIAWFINVLLYNNELSIKLSFTPYTTIAYLVPGHRSLVHPSRINDESIPCAVDEIDRDVTVSSDKSSKKRKKSEVITIDSDEEYD